MDSLVAVEGGGMCPIILASTPGSTPGSEAGAEGASPSHHVAADVGSLVMVVRGSAATTIMATRASVLLGSKVATEVRTAGINGPTMASLIIGRRKGRSMPSRSRGLSRRAVNQ